MKKFIRNNLFLLCAICMTIPTYAQSIQNCPSDEIRNEMLDQHHKYHQQCQHEDAIYQEKYLNLVQNGMEKSGQAVYSLPVVFHIVHSGETFGSYGNPSDEFILNKLAGVNVFMRMAQTFNPTYPDVSDYGVDTEIELCLAHEDPDGNFTNGIIRHYAPDIANVNFDYINYGQSIVWDNTRYVNIIMTGTLEVAAYYLGGPYDFIVTKKGLPALAHELGHYLSLWHTFTNTCDNSDCFNTGDRVCDTPPSNAPTYDAVTNTCTTDPDDTSTNNPFRPTSMGGLGDVNDMLGNMMDYGSPGGLFTIGQKTKMRNNIEVNRMTLLNNNTICSSTASVTNDAGVFDIYVEHLTNCDKNLDLTIQFVNYGSTILSQTQFEVLVNGNSFYTEAWTGALASGATSHHLLELQNLPVGMSTITVKTNSPNGSADEKLANDSASFDINILDADECFTFSNCQDMNLSTASGPGNNTIVNISDNFIANNISYVELCADAYGDVGSAAEVFNIYNESGINIGTTTPTGDCYTNAVKFCVNVSISDYLNWIADGQITVTFDPSSNIINPTHCTITPNQVCAYVEVGLDYPCTGMGAPCSDGDDCTINDVYDANCVCAGTFQDADGDGVCDLDDECNGHNDNTVPTLILQLDYFSEHISWSVNQSNQTILSQSYTTDDRRLYLDEKLCLPEGCYDFVINDSNCKGLTEYQDGFFILEDAAGIVLGTGSNFGCSETVSFCVAGAPCELAGQSCDDGDACTVNDIFDTSCNCVGTFVDNDNDGVCAVDDCNDNNTNIGALQAAGTACDDNDPLTNNDVILADGCTCQGISPCPGYALDDWSSSTLTHTGTGSNSITFTFSELKENVEFDITGINNITSGNPNNQYTEQVTISYTDINNNTIEYGVFANVSNVSVVINDVVQSVSVSLTDAVDGNTNATMSVFIGTIGSCTSGQTSGCGTGSNTCTSSAPLPTIPGIYTAEVSAVEGNWTYYCDCDGNLLLALDKTTAPTMVVTESEVSIKVEDGATYYPSGTGFISNPYGAAFMNRYWEVNPTTQPAPGETVGVKFYYTDASYQALKDSLSNRNTTWTVTSTSDLHFYKVTEVALGDFPAISTIQTSDLLLLANGGSSTAAYADNMHPNAVDHFAEFKVTSFSGGGGGAGDESSSPLPVELKTFTGKELDCERVLEWITSSEEDNSYFEIQKSYDGKEFSSIATVRGQTNASTENYYSHIDQSGNLSSTIYYRLKQFDVDGTSSYSPVVTIESECYLKEFSLYPNPVTNQIDISIENDLDQSIELEIISIYGTKFLSLPVNLNPGINTISIPTGDEFPSGTYFVQIKVGQRMISKKFIKMIK